MSRRVAIAASTALLLAGCAAKPIPDGYTGPLATVSDTVVQTSGTSGQFFVLWGIEGGSVDDSITRTTNANSGRGLSMSAVQASRQIPARPTTVRLKGKIHYAAPILELMNPS